MFDFAWTEIALIAVVALIAIGPKDLPVAIKAVTEMIKKARRMAAEFQTHVDDLMREANLDEVRSQINELRNFDIKGEVERAVDPDGSLRTTLATNPLATPNSYETPKPSEAAIGEHAETLIETPSDVDLVAARAGDRQADRPLAGCRRTGFRAAGFRDTPSQALTETPWQRPRSTTRSTTSRCRCWIT
jgi:sec-independent protein translocase protein TatB